MSESLNRLLARLDSVAAYEGPWRPLGDEAPRLRDRLAEMRRRRDQLEDVLVIALIGGSGVGKSTLLNAIAGDNLAETSAYRPCTEVPTIYHPHDVPVDWQNCRHVSGSALERLVIIDTPDTDTVVRQHRQTVWNALKRCDLVMLCGSPEKYLDDATWSLIRPLQAERTIACVETKAEESAGSLREHWVSRMEEQGFRVDAYFRVNAREAFDRKLAGTLPVPGEFDFPQLERYLGDELDRENINRIKRSNIAGLLSKTVGQLRERLSPRRDELNELERQLQEAETRLMTEARDLVMDRVFSEPHLWIRAQGQEIAFRAKGLVGGLYRFFQCLRALPERAAGWMPWSPGRSPVRRIASMLGNRPGLAEDLGLVVDTLRESHDNKSASLRLQFARRGFEPVNDDRGFEVFGEDFDNRLSHILRSSARVRLIKNARFLTSWPLVFMLDGPLYAVAGIGVYHLVRGFLTGQLLTGPQFLSGVSVFAVAAAAELMLLAWGVRSGAWLARRSAIRGVRAQLLPAGTAFASQREALDEARGLLDEIEDIDAALRKGFGAGRQTPETDGAAALSDGTSALQRE